MKDEKEISPSVISRLPRYYRFLCELHKQNAERVSSARLSEMMGLTASQIRQDFNCFGGFGQQGYGYNVEQLKNELAAILGLTELKSAVLLGTGNLGMAIAGKMDFEAVGFRLDAVFDCAEGLIGRRAGLHTVSDVKTLPAYCAAQKPDMAILCIPGEAAPEAVDTLIGCGVSSFWNFSHYDIRRRYPAATVENVHLSDSLMTLSYIINHRKAT